MALHAVEAPCGESVERIWSAAVELYHLFDEFDPAARDSAEAVIKAARDQLVPPTYLSAAAE